MDSRPTKAEHDRTERANPGIDRTERDQRFRAAVAHVMERDREILERLAET